MKMTPLRTLRAELSGKKREGEKKKSKPNSRALPWEEQSFQLGLFFGKVEAFGSNCPLSLWLTGSPRSNQASVGWGKNKAPRFLL